MLVDNIDHLESRLAPLTRVASSQFFVATRALHEVFRQVELGTDRDRNSALQQRAASISAEASSRAAAEFERAANLLIQVAQTISAEYPYLDDEIKAASAYDEAARYVGLPIESPILKEVSTQFIRTGHRRCPGHLR